MGQVHSTGPSLRSGFAWTVAGNAINGFSQWAILSIIAKLSTSEILGQYALATAVAVPVAMLAHLNLRSVLATDVLGRHPFSDYFAVRLAAGLAGLAVITGIGILWDPFWPVGAAIVLAGAAMTVENFEDLYYGVMQRDDRLDRVAKSMILRAGLSMFCVGAFITASRSAAAAAAGLFTGRIVTLLVFDLRNGKSPAAMREAPRGVFRAALPLGLVLMLVSLTAMIPRYVIERELGTAMLGAFAAVASFVTVGSTVINALGQTAITRLARVHANGQERLFRHLALRLTGLALAIGLTGVAVAILGGDFFLRVLYRPEYADYQWLLTEMLMAGTFGYIAVILGFAVTSTRRFDVQLPLQFVVAITSGLASLIAIPRFGLSGAALALGAAAFVQIAGQLIILRKAL